MLGKKEKSILFTWIDIQLLYIDQYGCSVHAKLWLKVFKKK